MTEGWGFRATNVVWSTRDRAEREDTSLLIGVTTFALKQGSEARRLAQVHGGVGGEHYRWSQRPHMWVTSQQQLKT